MATSITNYLESKKHLGLLFLRLFVGIRLLYGVIDNVLSWERMIEFSIFLESNAFPLPLVSAVLSVYVQFIFGSLLIVGFKTRLAAFVLILNFLVALIFVHIKTNDSIEGMTGALAMLFGCVTLMFTGADKVSLDALVKNQNHPSKN